MDNKELISIVYEYGLEKCAGDEQRAKEFAVGFLKEAFTAELGKGFVNGLGAAGAGLVAGLAIHGLSSGFQGAAMKNLRERFEKALTQAIASNPILQGADESKVRGFAETMFRFAPHVASDPNLLSSLLANAVHGESVDPNTIRALADLESRYQETRKNALFTPKNYK